MRYIDFTIQTLIILFGIGILVATWGEPNWPIQLLLAQMFLGPWQVLSSIVGVLGRGAAHKLKRTHLVTSALYFLVIIMASWIGSMLNYEWREIIIAVYLILPPWILALYYYSITWRITFPSQRKDSSFLPHINF